MHLHNPPALVLFRALSPQWRALYALHCCGIIRAKAANREWAALVSQGYALPRFFGPMLGRDQADFIITDLGRKRAREVF